MGDYNYKLDVFEGPLDLLLHLIEKHKIEITDISIVEITSQYLEYLDNWNHFDIHYSSDLHYYKLSPVCYYLRLNRNQMKAKIHEMN